MIVGGDVGGTKTLLGLFEADPPEDGRRADRPRAVATYSYATSAYASIGEILDEFRRAVGPLSVEAAAIGVAGPVVGNAAKLTNISWGINAPEIAAGLGTARVQILNDLEALANGVAVLT